MKIPSLLALAASCAVFCAAGQPAPPVSGALAAFNQKNYTLAAQTFKQAASAANPTAELMLGYLYENGFGVAKDPTQASQWYALALTKTDDIARDAPSAKDESFLRSVMLKAKDFVLAHRANEQPSVSSIYTGSQYRDPFAPLGASAEPSKKFTRADFNIHHLALRGIMDDGHSGYALFTDPGYGVSFVLKRGRLFDDRGHEMPGVWGTVSIRAKTAELETSDQDVQPFRLGSR
ncbi:MAG TPA: hypothetical protein VNH15_02335 [Elusimicrobiota bacterium]|nr:hypothetical protein [Elusimicrobiota bacterium]